MARLLALVLVLAGCGNDVIVLEAVTGGIDRSCPRADPSGTLPEAWPIRSIRVEAIEWYSGIPGDSIVSECAEDIRGLEIVHPQQMIDWYATQGYLVRGIPAEVPVHLQVIGFSNTDCAIVFRPIGPLICGLSYDAISQSTFTSGDSVRIQFACPSDPRDPMASGLYAQCLLVGSLPEE
jgi:hypothetical protein